MSDTFFFGILKYVYCLNVRVFNPYDLHKFTVKIEDLEKSSQIHFYSEHFPKIIAEVLIVLY